MVNWNKEVLHRCISQIFFIDTEQLSKMQIYLQVFFKDFIDRLRISYLENGFLWIYFSNILLLEFWLATNLKTYLPTYPPTYLPMYSFHNCVTIWVGIGKKEGGGGQKGLVTYLGEHCAWFILRSFFLLRLLYTSLNPRFGHAWNTVVIFRMVVVTATWNC